MTMQSTRPQARRSPSQGKASHRLLSGTIARATAPTAPGRPFVFTEGRDRQQDPLRPESMHIEIKKFSCAIAQQDSSAWYAVSSFKAWRRPSRPDPTYGRRRRDEPPGPGGCPPAGRGEIDIGTEVQPRPPSVCGLIDIAAMFKSFYHGITCFLWKYRCCANGPFLYRSTAKTAGSVKQ